MPKHHHFRSHVPASRALSFLNPEKLTSLLSSLVPESGDREFLYRCLVEEGPICWWWAWRHTGWMLWWPASPQE